MSDPFANLVKQLSSKGDWAVALPAALTGFVADAATHIVPATVLMPAECGLVAGFAGLAVKRVVEAVTDRRTSRERRTRASYEAAMVAQQLEDNGKATSARELLFEASMTDDIPAILAAIRRARSQL